MLHGLFHNYRGQAGHCQEDQYRNPSSEDGYLPGIDEGDYYTGEDGCPGVGDLHGAGINDRLDIRGIGC